MHPAAASDPDRFPLPVLCTACDARHTFAVENVVSAIGQRQSLEAKGIAWPEGWDGLFVAEVLACPSCGAEDSWTSRPLATLGALLMHPQHVQMGAPVAWDGTVMTRASAGRRHLLQVAERLDTGEAWRRAGNFAERIQDFKTAITCWQRAITFDDELEAFYSLAMVCHEAEDADQAWQLAAECVCRFPDHGRHLTVPAKHLLRGVFQVLEAHAPRPLAVNAVWLGGTVPDGARTVCASSALLHSAPIAGLVEFLTTEEVMGVALQHPELPLDEYEGTLLDRRLHEGPQPAPSIATSLRPHLPSHAGPSVHTPGNRAERRAAKRRGRRPLRR